MKSLFSNLPQSLIGAIYLACGAIILLDVVGAIRSGLLGAVGAGLLIWQGFLLLDGPKHVKKVIDHLQRKR